MIHRGFERRTDDLVGLPKVPGETVDVTFDWSPELAVGQAISSAAWTVGSGLTGSNEGLAGALATKRIAGGLAGTDYRLTCTITKNNGEIVPRTVVISVVAELS